MGKMMEEAIKGFGLYHSSLLESVVEYREDPLGYLIVELKDGSTLLYDDSTGSIRGTSAFDERFEFGKRLRLLLYRRGMSQKELSEKSGITQANISQYINGKRVPSYQVVCSLADALDCSTDSFRFVGKKK